MNLKPLYRAASWLSALILTGCVYGPGCQPIVGNGKVVSENRSVSGIDQVALAGQGELTITQGEQESLSIQTDENLLALIHSEVRGGCLYIDYDNGNLRPTHSIRYQLSLKQLKGVQLSGSAHIQAAALQSDKLRLQVSGSGQIHLPQLQAKGLAIQISGSGDSSVGGVVERQDVAISGSGSHQAEQLKSQTAAAHISGSGRATVWVEKELSAHISGSGHVGYYGAPQVERAVSGSGRVESLGSK